MHTESMSEWEKRYQELVEFKSRHGHTNVPLHHSSGKYQDFGQWVSLQRRLYRQHREAVNANGTGHEEGSLQKKSTSENISLTQVSLLDALGFEVHEIPNIDLSDDNDLNLFHNNQESIMKHVDIKEIGLIDIADAFTIRAVMHSPERKRQHNKLMHTSLKAYLETEMRAGNMGSDKQVDVLNEFVNEDITENGQKVD